MVMIYTCFDVFPGLVYWYSLNSLVDCCRAANVEVRSVDNSAVRSQQIENLRKVCGHAFNGWFINLEGPRGGGEGMVLASS